MRKIFEEISCFSPLLGKVCTEKSMKIAHPSIGSIFARLKRQVQVRVAHPSVFYDEMNHLLLLQTHHVEGKK